MSKEAKTRPGRNKPSYLPTPEEIEQATERIQEGWSDHVRRRRATGTKEPARLTVPMVSIGQVRGRYYIEEVG